MGRTPKVNYSYEDEDRYVILNDDDPDLTPIVLELPKAPAWTYIAGYGKPAEEQRFSKMEIPKKLLKLEKEVHEELKASTRNDKTKTVTLYRIQQKFWELLISRHKEYKDEIDFIRRVWWHRLNGYWFFNKGKPTYITGWHFMYLNFWNMSIEGAIKTPDYRDRDRKEFIFHKYCNETTETFARLDESGFAIREPDGTFLTQDTQKRICSGLVQPKNRRSGNTNKGLNIGLEIVTRTIGTDGMGIMSYTGSNAEESFQQKMLPAYDEFPLWLKPLTSSSRQSDHIRFDANRHEYIDKGLRTQVTYASTGNYKFYDSKKLVFALMDEEGKDSENEILKRWDVVKNTLGQGNMRLIHGYSYHPSTVDEITDGAYDYRFLADNSNFYKRVKTSGQTTSSMFRLFVPADEGLDDFIDSYGYSVKGEITDWQKKEGFTMTATEYLQGERDALLRENTLASMARYREQRKLFPLKYADCWLGEAGDIGFNMDNIDNRMAELRRQDDTRKGNFRWVNDVFGGEVFWEDNEEEGRFQIAMFPPKNISNQKSQAMHFSTFENKMVPMWKPANPGTFTLGVDPFRFSNNREANIKAAKGGSRSKLSDGGIAVLWNYDADVDRSKGSMYNWESYKFVLSYRYRARNSDELSEDALKAAIFFGAMVYPETNCEDTYSYFIRHNFGGYLIYDEDIVTGAMKAKPGVFNLDNSKQKLFSGLRDYIETRCHVEPFMEFLKECKEINSMEEMRMYDRLTAHGLAIMGSKSTYVNKILAINSVEYDLSDFVEMFNY